MNELASASAEETSEPRIVVLFIHLFITWIYKAPLQGYYSQALPTLARLNRTVLSLIVTIHCTSVFFYYIDLLCCILLISDPEKRSQGGFSYIGLFIVLGATICFAWHLITAK